MTGSIEAAGAADAVLARRIMEAPGPEALGAEAELCARFAGRVRSYGRRHLFDEDATADLVQRVLVLALEKLRRGEVREPDRIASFILGTARMISRDIRRERAKEVPADPEAVASLPDAALRTPEPLAREHLARCLGELDERSRSVIVLSFFDERSADEIAGVLSVSKGNVRVIRHRAVQSLRDCMGVGEEEVHA